MSPDSLEIDRRFKGVGRLKRRIGSTNPVLKRKYERMLDALVDDGRTDIIRAIKLKQLSWAEVYEAHVRRRLDALPLGPTAKLLADDMQRWLDGLLVGDYKGADCSTKHFESLTQARKYFIATKAKARVAELPELLETMRNKLGVKHPTSYNRARSAALTYIRSTLKRSHPLWIAISAVEPRRIRERDKREGIALTPAQMRFHFPHRETDDVDAIAWGIAITGMGETEYWGKWRTLADRVHIAGTKRGGRVRDVPLIFPPAVPRMHPRTFTDKLRERTNRAIQPYDLRRTYMSWLVDAEISRPHRKRYLGHGSGDTSGLYERREHEQLLAEHAKRLREVLGLPSTETSTLTLHKERGA